MSRIVDAKDTLVPSFEIYQKASWVNFARNNTTELIEDRRIILYVRIVEFSIGGGTHYSSKV